MRCLVSTRRPFAQHLSFLQTLVNEPEGRKMNGIFSVHSYFERSKVNLVEHVQCCWQELEQVERDGDKIGVSNIRHH